MASEKNNNYSDSSSEDTMDRESEKLNDDNNGIGRSYECNFCKRGFTNAQALGGHMNIHRKDKLKAKQNNSLHQESSKLSKEANYAFDNSRYYASPISSHDELQQHHYSRAQMNSYQFHHFQLPQNPSYQHVYNHHDHHDDSRLRHDNYYDANNLSLRIGSTLINDDDEEGGVKKDVDESELDLELRLGYSNH